MSEFVHYTVLKTASVDALKVRNDGVYVDCTVGGGGHSELILQHGARCLIAIDRDATALAAARSRLAAWADRVVYHHGPFGEIASAIASAGFTTVDGIVADLGVSSPQLDHANRGFSFSKPGPLDMRMDTSRGETAAELIAKLDAAELADVIYEYGEERYSRKIAAAVKAAAASGKLATTVDLANVIASVIPIKEQRTSRIHPATRTFQALRIAVNAELDQLKALLAVFPDLLNAGGRCAIISFHSLEDRMVKHRFRELAWSSSLPEQYAQQAGERVAPVCELISRQAVTASADETNENPRSRSARLRICERTAAPNLPTGTSLGVNE